jgi:hypothetical protein
MKSFILFTHKNKQENRTAAILKIKTLKNKDEEREIIMIIAIRMVLISYLTEKLLSVAAVSLLDSKLDVHLPLKYKKKENPLISLVFKLH